MHSESIALAHITDYTFVRIPAVSNRWTSKEMMCDPHFAALFDDGSLFLWSSDAPLGIVVEKPPERNVISVFSSGTGFISLLDNQELITANPCSTPSDYPAPKIPQGHYLVSLVSNWNSFAALLENGKIFSWGRTPSPDLPPGQKAISIFPSGSSFCAVLEKEQANAENNTQTLLSWGEVKTPPFSLGKQKVISIIGNEEGFCALLDDGTLRLWGKKNNTIEEPFRDSIQKVAMKKNALCATSKSFIALLENGTIHAWGDLETPELPYDNSDSWFPSLSSQRLHVVSLTSNYEGITATLEDGSFLTARVHTSIIRDASGKRHVHREQITDHIPTPCNSHGQKLELSALVASDSAFTALFENGSVVSWGDEGAGGKTPNLGHNKAIEVVPSGGSFTALLDNGKIQSWGDITRGGQTPTLPKDSQGNEVTVQKMSGNCSWMSALLSDGTLLLWGWGIANNQVSINLPAGKKIVTFVSPFEKFVLRGTFFKKEYQNI